MEESAIVSELGAILYSRFLRYERRFREIYRANSFPRGLMFLDLFDRTF